MDENLKAKWLRALRSGKYLQARGHLKAIRRDGKIGYCCLGVLSVVAHLGEFEDKPQDACTRADVDHGASKNRGHFPLNTPEGSVAGNLPTAFAEKQRLNVSSYDRESATNLTVEDRLVDLNDGKKASFRTIANWIEKNL